MIIVADSGSTKTDWAILNKNQQIVFKTKGINPLFLEKEEVAKDIISNFPKGLMVENIESIFFYGPGCSTKARSLIVEEALRLVFLNAKTVVESDLLGAARALFQKERGIACILGTGSNSGLYDNGRIEENILSTGFILGDEGSGAHMGLELVKQYINQKLERETQLKFQEAYQLSIEQIIDKVYKQAYPNRFLASFSPFIVQNIKDPVICAIVEKSFADFFDLHILPYQEAQNLPISFVGSIAYHFKSIIVGLVEKHNLQLGGIVQKPIDDLVKYHINN